MQSSSRDQKPSLFLQIFLLVTYWEPFIFELLVGLIFIVFPESSLVLGTFLPKPLVQFMISNDHRVASSSSSMSGLIAGVSSPVLRESILFTLRFAGVMIFCFGMLHYLLIRVNFNILSNNNQQALVSSQFFHWTVLVLGIGDLLHVGAVLVFLNHYFKLVGPTDTGDSWDAVSNIAIAIVSSIILVSMRVYFLLKYSSLRR
ncbi:hypothetical protein C9374_014251 [Naegleria lovaniensis]|uniref:Uncharacterized protein n=1 Tax=Naegleria lovaniensis TaxID=51637 RepID=A0AA88G8W3_NAELO|nr:uncharacterized protein C9374_014251 [Naegleria lovaniensis]KAG2370757.1 hypothetical protein C9374_014251 [Naegleria lovaniensis]